MYLLKVLMHIFIFRASDIELWEASIEDIEVCEIVEDKPQGFDITLSHVEFHGNVNYSIYPLPSTSLDIRNYLKCLPREQFFRSYSTADLGFDFDAKHVSNDGIEHSVQLGHYASEPIKKEFFVLDDTLCVKEFSDSLNSLVYTTNSSHCQQCMKDFGAYDTHKTTPHKAKNEHRNIRIEHKYNETLYELLVKKLDSYIENYFISPFDDRRYNRLCNPENFVIMLNDHSAIHYMYYRNMFYLATYFYRFRYFRFTNYDEKISEYHFSTLKVDYFVTYDSSNFLQMMVSFMQDYGPYVSNAFKLKNKKTGSDDIFCFGLLKETDFENVILVPYGFYDTDPTYYKLFLSYLYNNKGDCVGFIAIVTEDFEVSIVNTSSAEFA